MTAQDVCVRIARSKDLTLLARVVLADLYARGVPGEMIRASDTDLGLALGTNPRTVRKAVYELRNAGLVRVERDPECHRRRVIYIAEAE